MPANPRVTSRNPNLVPERGCFLENIMPLRCDRCFTPPAAPKATQDTHDIGPPESSIKGCITLFPHTRPPLCILEYPPAWYLKVQDLGVDPKRPSCSTAYAIIICSTVGFAMLRCRLVDVIVRPPPPPKLLAPYHIIGPRVPKSTTGAATLLGNAAEQPLPRSYRSPIDPLKPNP